MRPFKRCVVLGCGIAIACPAGVMAWCAAESRQDRDAFDLAVFVFRVAELDPSEARRPLYPLRVTGNRPGGEQVCPLKGEAEDGSRGLKHEFSMDFRDAKFPIAADIAYHMVRFKEVGISSRGLGDAAAIDVKGERIRFDSPSSTVSIASTDGKYLLVVVLSPSPQG